MNEKDIWKAVEKGDNEFLREFLANGGDPNLCASPTTEDTLLYWAAYAGRVGCVRALLEAGAKVDKARWDGTTPLAAAASEGHIMVCRVLLDHGANPNTQCNEDGDFYTPLHCAARYGHPDVCRLLLGRGADPSIKAWDGATAADLARDKGQDEAATAIEAFSV